MNDRSRPTQVYVNVNGWTYTNFYYEWETPLISSLEVETVRGLIVSTHFPSLVVVVCL